MSAITGTFRNGKIELHGPPPADWQDGTEVSVSAGEFSMDNVDFCLPPAPSVQAARSARELPTEDIDPTGDSPEAIAAWFQWYDEFTAATVDSTFPEELAAFLSEWKEEELAGWDEHCKKLDGLFK